MKTYFIRVACRWVRVKTSYAVFLKVPHAIVSGACKLGPVLIATLLVGASAAAPIMQINPTEIVASPAQSGGASTTAAGSAPGSGDQYAGGMGVGDDAGLGGAGVGEHLDTPSACCSQMIPPMTTPKETVPPTSVPEPASLAIFGIALLLVRGLRRR